MTPAGLAIWQRSQRLLLEKEQLAIWQQHSAKKLSQRVNSLHMGMIIGSRSEVC